MSRRKKVEVFNAIQLYQAHSFIWINSEGPKSFLWSLSSQPVCHLSTSFSSQHSLKSWCQCLFLCSPPPASPIVITRSTSVLRASILYLVLYKPILSFLLDSKLLEGKTCVRFIFNSLSIYHSSRNAGDLQ